jgi:MoxR-like ATPase
MEEHEVTAGGTTHNLDEPFFVLATQNPIEQEGTYPLPEAQLDRFMFNIHLTYPDRESEEEIVRRTTAGTQFDLEPVLDASEVIDIQKVVRKIPASDAMISYAVGIVSQTRPSDASAPEFVRNWIRWGAGPRASQYLILGAKARSVLRGNYFVSTEDIQAVAHEVLGHRIVINFQAESEGVTSRDIIQRLLDETQTPSG